MFSSLWNAFAFALDLAGLPMPCRSMDPQEMNLMESRVDSGGFQVRRAQHSTAQHRHRMGWDGMGWEKVKVFASPTVSIIHPKDRCVRGRVRENLKLPNSPVATS